MCWLTHKTLACRKAAHQLGVTSYVQGCCQTKPCQKTVCAHNTRKTAEYVQGCCHGYKRPYKCEHSSVQGRYQEHSSGKHKPTSPAISTAAVDTAGRHCCTCGLPPSLRSSTSPIPSTLLSSIHPCWDLLTAPFPGDCAAPPPSPQPQPAPAP